MCVNKDLHSKEQPSDFGFTLQGGGRNLIWAAKLLTISMQIQWIFKKGKYNRLSPIQKVFLIHEP